MNKASFLFSLLITTSLLAQSHAFAMDTEPQQNWKTNTKKSSSPSEEEAIMRKASRDIGAFLVSQKSSLDQFWLRVDPEEFNRNLSSLPFSLKADATLEEFVGSAATQLTNNINDALKIYTTPCYQTTLLEPVLLKPKTKRPRKISTDVNDTLKSALEDMLLFLHETEQTFLEAFSNLIQDLHPHKELQGYIKFLQTSQTEKTNKQKAEEDAKTPLSPKSEKSSSNSLINELTGRLKRLEEMKKKTEITYKTLTARPQQMTDLLSNDGLSSSSSENDQGSSSPTSPNANAPLPSRFTPSSTPPSSSKKERKEESTRNRSFSVGGQPKQQVVISNKDLNSVVLKRADSDSSEKPPVTTDSTPPSSLSDEIKKGKKSGVRSFLRRISTGSKDKDAVKKTGSSPELNQPNTNSDTGPKRSSTSSLDQDASSSSSSGNASPQKKRK